MVPAIPDAALVPGPPDKGGPDALRCLRRGRTSRPRRSSPRVDAHGLRAAMAELGYKQELSRSWCGILQLRHQASRSSPSWPVASPPSTAGGTAAVPPPSPGAGPSWPALVLCIGLCLSELVSAYPTSGGIYWWASKLGGVKAGYYTGWLNLIGLLAITASVAYGCATLLDLTLGFLLLHLAGTAGSLHTIFLFFIGILVISAIVNIFSSHLLAMVNNVSVWWHVFGAAAVVLILVFLPHHHASASMVFTSTVNNTGLLRGQDPAGSGSSSSSCPSAALLTQYTITGYDASAHLSEETHSRGQLGGQGHVALDLLLGHRRLDPAAGLPLRRAGRVEGDGGRRRRGDNLLPALASRVGWRGAVHLHGGPVLLHHGLYDQLLPDALRLQP